MSQYQISFTVEAEEAEVQSYADRIIARMAEEGVALTSWSADRRTSRFRVQGVNTKTKSKADVTVEAASADDASAAVEADQPDVVVVTVEEWI